MKTIKYEYYMGDFETTVYDGQTTTEVWASAVVKFDTEDVHIFHSIDDTFNYLRSLKKHICIYYHNLKFDGNFWLSYLMNVLHFEQASKVETDEGYFNAEFIKEKDMKNNTFKYSISDMGLWYNIIVKIDGHYIQFRDSLKLLPFSVREIGEGFQTKHRKLEMEYSGYRYAGCDITEKEKEYIINDVMVVKEALEFMFAAGHNKLTIGACAMAEYHRMIDDKDFELMFPSVYDIELDKCYEARTAGDYIHRAYKGGWCFLVPEKSNKIHQNGVTADCNSLYPSVMSGESGNRYPVGKPIFWRGDYIPLEALRPSSYYFIRIKTRFYIKNNKLPCIQIKGSPFYRGTEWLYSSDVFNKKDGRYYDHYIDKYGNVQPATVTLTLTMTDFELIKEQYELVDFEILDGCYFATQVGIFDIYINKYRKMKIENKGAKRQLAKLLLNTLYGKFAASKNSSFKYAYIVNGVVEFIEVEEYNKKPGFIPIGAAITSYARNFTIRAAQANYYGADSAGFIYADTDSIHCDLPQEQLKGITIHSKNFCAWKIESEWDKGFYVRQKTYIERVNREDDKQLEMPKYIMRCAGMPEKCKRLFELSLRQITTSEEWEKQYPNEWDELTDYEKQFVLTPRRIEDFKIGLVIGGKLMPKRIKGGVLLVETTFEMR